MQYHKRPRGARSVQQLFRFCTESPRWQVFQSLFEFLDENWAKLSPNVMKALKDTPLVPVGARLIKAGRLFFRLKVGGHTEQHSAGLMLPCLPLLSSHTIQQQCYILGSFL